MSSVTMSSVVLTKEAGVGVITLNRPDFYNAIDQVLANELLERLNEAALDPTIRAVILTGAGKAFCSGQDLKDASALQKQGEHFALGKTVRQRYNRIILALATMDKPTIAVVNGIAAGAGCSLALACDMRFIAPHTRFVEAFVRIGLVPDSGSSYFLPRLVGIGRALEIAMSGRDVGAEEAVQIGMANRIIPVDELMSESMTFAQTLAEGPTVAIGLTKKAIYRGMEGSLEEALECEAESQEKAGRTADFLEGISAFSEKRKAVFRGC